MTSSVVGPGMTAEEFGHLDGYARVSVARLVSNTSSQQKEGPDPFDKGKPSARHAAGGVLRCFKHSINLFTTLKGKINDCCPIANDK